MQRLRGCSTWVCLLFGQMTVSLVGQEVVIPNTDANDFVLSAGNLYWAVRAEPDCFSTGIGGSIHMASAGGGPVTTLFQGTDCYNPRLLRVAGANLFFVDGTSIKRLWTGATGTLIPQEVAASNGSVRDMEIDTHYVWWIDDDGIKQRFNGGTGSILLYFDPFLTATELATPLFRDADLFW